MQQRHPGQWVHCPYLDEYLFIDKDIVELVSLMWSLGIATVSSCQANNSTHVVGDEELVWIMFRSVVDSNLFVTYCIKHGVPSHLEAALFNASHWACYPTIATPDQGRIWVSMNISFRFQHHFLDAFVERLTQVKEGLQAPLSPVEPPVLRGV
jgi:hypothetical protein